MNSGGKIKHAGRRQCRILPQAVTGHKGGKRQGTVIPKRILNSQAGKANRQYRGLGINRLAKFVLRSFKA